MVDAVDLVARGHCNRCIIRITEFRARAENRCTGLDRLTIDGKDVELRVAVVDEIDQLVEQQPAGLTIGSPPSQPPHTPPRSLMMDWTKQSWEQQAAAGIGADVEPQDPLVASVGDVQYVLLIEGGGRCPSSSRLSTPSM